MWPQPNLGPLWPLDRDHVRAAITLAVVLCPLIIASTGASHEMTTNRRITNYEIPVNMRIIPAHILDNKNYIATNLSFTAKAEILNDTLKTESMEYQWSVKGQMIIKKENLTEIQHSFSLADESQFVELLVTSHKNETGLCRKNIVIRDQIVVHEPEGKLFLEHGDLIDILISFGGIGPFTYCYKFCLDIDRRRGSADCSACSPDTKTTRNQVTIIKYLHNVGNYQLLFAADNIVSRVSKSWTIKITDTVRPQSIPYVPIVSSILAVVIVLTGVALNMKFKQTILTETADFDFLRHDNNEEDDFWDEEHDFWQRVRYLFFTVNRDYDVSMSDSFRSTNGHGFL